MPNRKQKRNRYEEKYGDIPTDETERFHYMIEKYHLSDRQMSSLLSHMQMMKQNLQFINIGVVVLYEEPEGAKRPRYRITHKNYTNAALANSEFVQVYSPNAAEDHRYMKQLTATELSYLINSGLIYQPCRVQYNIFLRTPEAFSVEEKFLAEAGWIRPSIDKPDWDNAGKKYCDMYNANIFLDDAQVIDGSVHKYYSCKPRIEISLQYLNHLYTKKQANRIAGRKDFDDQSHNGIRYLDIKGDVQQL